ncbi:hypothetical protein [Candidatus Nitrosoglobus terrae]|nr:hypothetical protein [Candidatus Nitrosoglobus terrae]
MRNWSDSQSGRIQLGSDAHKQMFCRFLLETHHPYKPEEIKWPKLSPEVMEQVAKIPIWDIAIQTEGRASIRVATYAKTITDKLLRAALDMDASEEARHKIALGQLVVAYNILIAPEPDYLAPKDAEWAWLVTGYSECIDSFFAFGLFESAKRFGFFPAELVEIFEPVVQEEARHILFFVNWVAWHRHNLRWWKRPLFFIRTFAVWVFLIWERISIVRGLDDQGEMQDANFAVTGSKQMGINIQPKELFELCLIENKRRMEGYDYRLLRPAIVPFIVQLACKFMKGT